MKCPGQDMQYWRDDAIYEVECPKCTSQVEFYKDDTTRKCTNCNHRFVNPKMDFGCAAYCQFAQQCLGTLPEEFVMQQDGLLKDKVAVEVKKYLKTDFKRIGFASKMARYAENIGRATEGANLAKILCSAYLCAIGFHEAAKKSPEALGQDLQQHNLALAQEILHKIGADEKLISEVCNIIGNDHHGLSDSCLNSKIVEDAYILTALETEHSNGLLDDNELHRRLALLTTEQAHKEAKKIVQS